MLSLRSTAASARGRRRVALVWLTTVGLAAVPLCSPALAGTTSLARTSAVKPVSPLASTLTDEGRAVTEAQRTGKTVVVESARTETGDVVANPSGTLTLTEHAIPVRVRRGSAWQPIDTNLVARSDGRLGPKAAVTDVTFSKGGTDPLVRLSTQGRSVDIDWPGELPAPVIDGSRITYPEVMAGVDLTLNADVDGFSQALVVKTAEAAQNPELRAVEFALKTTSLTLETTTAGVIQAVNPAGQVILASSTPRMWDSAGVQGAPAPAAPSSARASQADGGTGTGTVEVPSDLDQGAHTAQVDVSIDGTKKLLVLEPDRALLDSAETVYPLYIDPRFTGTRSAWTIAYKKHPTSSFWNGSGWGGGSTNQARVGYEKEDGGTGRSFFRLDSRKLAGVQILDAQFHITETHSWSCSARPVDLWLTGGINSKTTWKNQPKWSKKLASKNVAHGNETYGCADAGVDFDATYAAEQAAAKKWSYTTFGLKANKENDTYAWKKFKTDAKLIVDFNRTPNVPTEVDTVPSTNNGANCGAQAPHVTVGLTDMQFSARVKDPDGGTVRARFKIWPSGSGQESIVDTYKSVTSGSIANLKVSRDVFKASHPNGGQFSWTVLANDTKSSSAWATSGGAYCHFDFDPVRPVTRPKVTSTVFPDGEDGAVGAPARTPADFTISSGGVKDVTEYYYSLDRSPPTTKKVPATPGGAITVRLTPASTGPHKVYVYSQDAAKNKSDTTVYLFYAGSAGITDKPGDVNGDANPDLYAVEGSRLRMHPGAGTTAALGPVTEVSSDVAWTKSLITHRGDWTDDGYEDLVARRDDGKLWMYPTDGLGELVESERQSFLQFAASDPVQEDPEPEDPTDPPIEEPEAAQAARSEVVAAADEEAPLLDLATIDQISSLGDISNELEAIAPDFVAVVDDQLWYLEGYPGAALGDGYPIGDSGWAGVTVTAAGDHDKDGFVDLFVRERTSGKLWLQRGKPDALDPARTDPASLGNPANRILLESTNWTAAARPLITSVGDANGDGVNDLWATDSAGKLLFVRSKPGLAGEAATTIATTGWAGMTAIS